MCASEFASDGMPQLLFFFSGNVFAQPLVLKDVLPGTVFQVSDFVVVFVHLFSFNKLKNAIPLSYCFHYFC